MKREFLSILFFFPLICFGQVYVTDNPYVSSSNCDYCRIAKVIVTEKETKILLEVTGQKGKNPLVKISNWTVLLPFNSNLNLSELRNFDLNIPEISEVPRFDEVEEEHVLSEEKKYCENIMRSQPTTTTIFKRDKEFDLPYPELFDRTERTIAA